MDKLDYRVEVETRGCECCEHGRQHSVVYGSGDNETQLSRTFSDIDDAEFVAQTAQDAYDKGVDYGLHTLRNVSLVATRIVNRSNKGELNAQRLIEDIGHIMRFCEEAGVKPSILREETGTSATFGYVGDDICKLDTSC